MRPQSVAKEVPEKRESAGGRPSKFKDEYIDQVAKLCALGATDLEIADFFGVNVATLHRWKHSFPAFCDALKVAKEIADKRVERSLFARANGYEHDEVHVSNYQGAITLTPIRKIYPPDTTAAIFWLKNRKPAEWRDKVDHDHGGEINVNLGAKEKLAARIASLAKRSGSGQGDSGADG